MDDLPINSLARPITLHFGTKAHIGIDSRTKLVHQVKLSAANVHNSVVIGDLLHGDEMRGWGETAYTGKDDVIAEHAPQATDFTQKKGMTPVTSMIASCWG